MAGEPVVDYALRLEKEYGTDGLWVAGYCNDVFAYIPSLRVLQEGGYEGGGAIVGARLPGPFAPSIEETIVRKVHELVATVCGAAETPPAGYQLAWSDEFDGATLDMNKWSYRGLGQRHDALNVTDAVSVGGGQLTITTYTSGGKHYAGMIGTEGKFERRFGYWVARLQFEGAPGMWSAFWIQTPTFGRPAGDPVTAGMEIDVIEHRVSDKSGKDISGKAQHSLHYGSSDKDVKSQSHVPAGSSALTAIRVTFPGGALTDCSSKKGKYTSLTTSRTASASNGEQFSPFRISLRNLASSVLEFRRLSSSRFLFRTPIKNFFLTTYFFRIS